MVLKGPLSRHSNVSDRFVLVPDGDYILRGGERGLGGGGGGQSGWSTFIRKGWNPPLTSATNRNR